MIISGSDKLPVISGKECMKALAKIDFYIRRRKSSHVVMRMDNPFAQVTVPDHKNIDRGTLRAIIRGAGLAVEEFNRLLD